MLANWAPPDVGDLVWCRFPESPGIDPGPKPRPALVVRVTLMDDGAVIDAVYGTSQRLDRLLAGEFAIRKSQHPGPYALAGLSFDTKFNFKRIVQLPWNDNFFKVPPRANHGQNPKLGTLHPAMLGAARAAYLATAGT